MEDKEPVYGKDFEVVVDTREEKDDRPVLITRGLLAEIVRNLLGREFNIRAADIPARGVQGFMLDPDGKFSWAPLQPPKPGIDVFVVDMSQPTETGEWMSPDELKRLYDLPSKGDPTA